MEELTKDQNDHINNDTHIQILNVRLNAIDRQVFNRENIFIIPQGCFRFVP